MSARKSGKVLAKRSKLDTSTGKTRKDNPTTQPHLISCFSKNQKNKKSRKPTIFDEIRHAYREKTGGTLSNAQIGLLLGTKHKRRNVYGFGMPEVLLLFIRENTFKGIITPFAYLRDIASHPTTVESWIKKYRQEVQQERSLIGRVLDSVMHDAWLKKEVADRDKKIRALERELERLR